MFRYALLKLHDSRSYTAVLAVLGFSTLSIVAHAVLGAEAPPVDPAKEEVTERALKVPRPPTGPVPIPYPNTKARDEDSSAGGTVERQLEEEVTERGGFPSLMPPTFPASAPLVSQVQYPSSSFVRYRCFIVVPDLRPGSQVYVDKNDVYYGDDLYVPLRGATYIRPCVGPIPASAYPTYPMFPAGVNPFLSFVVSKPAAVYIALPPFLPKPPWLNSFLDLERTIEIRHRSGVTRWKVFVRNYPAGPVVLGGNGGSGSSSSLMYTVAVREGWNTVAPAPGGVKPVQITNLHVQLSNAPTAISAASSRCFSVVQGLRADVLVYGDRDDTYYGPPALVSGATFVRPCIGPLTGQLPQGMPQYALVPTDVTSFLSFAVNQPATVYVGLPSSLTLKPPSWLSTFTDTGENISVSSPNRQYLKLFARNYPAGSIVLGGNGATDEWQGIYTVMVMPGWNSQVKTPTTTLSSPFQPLSR